MNLLSKYLLAIAPPRCQRGRIVRSLVLLIAALGLSQPAQAEGSRDLTASGGDRPYLEYRSSSAANIERKSIVYVYANVGETINLGSSAVGRGSGVINYRRPDGSSGTCGAIGLIATRTQESNGTFIPCTVTVNVGQAGVWEIHFVSPVISSTADPPPLAATANWSQPDTVGYVSAWDVTVRNSLGAAVTGRVFANYFAFNVGSNNRSLSPAFQILTRDGYQYSIDLNGMDPFGFIFFSNNRGFRNSSGSPIYRSLQLVGANPGSLPSGYSFQNPNTSDTSTDTTHKIFINSPDTSLPASAPSANGSVWLYQPPTPPPIPTNFTFTGIEGTSGRAGTNPLGGTFSFNTTGIGSYSIALDLNQDGVYGNGNDRIFTGITAVGTNTVFWDGKDGSGANIPASSIPYGAQVVLYAGEAHFPFLDAENNLNGIIIQRTNNPTPSTTPIPDPYLVYYNDRNSGSSGTDYTLCASGETGSDCYGTPPNPRSALAGVNSSGGTHRFSSLFGDRRGVDTWVYYPSQPVSLNGGILLQQADLEITKTDGLTTIQPGSPITYTITVTNRGSSNVTGARVADTIPSSITNVTWTCSITTGTGGCGNNSGSGNTLNTTVNLNNGAIATYTVQGTVSTSASGTLTNTATVQRPQDVTDPVTTNNTATDTTNIVPSADLSITKTDGQISIIAGSPTSYTITVTNNGPSTVSSVTVTDTVPSAIQNPVFTASTGSYNSSTGAWTGLNLASGQSITLTLSGTVSSTATGTITNTATVVPPTGVTDSIAGNNTSTDNTNIYSVSPTAGQIIINEVLYAQTGAGLNATTNDEFIELYNASSTSVDLSGWKLADGNLIENSTDNTGSITGSSVNPAYSFPIGTILAPGQYAVVWIGSNTPDHQATGAAFQAWLNQPPKLNNTGDDVWLYDNQLRIVDYVAYGSNSAINTPPPASLNFWNTAYQASLATANAGQSISLTPNGVDGNSSACWEPTTSGQSNGRCTGYLPTTDTDPIGTRTTTVGQNNNGTVAPNLVLVKRITAINGVEVVGFVDDPGSTDDNVSTFPSPTNTYLRGAINGGLVRPGDVLEYTIYFLSNGGAPATNVSICDLVPANSTFVSNAFNGMSPEDTGGLPGVDRGIALGLSAASFPTVPTTYLSNVQDGDRAQFFPPGTTPPISCSGINSSGAVVVNIVTSPSSLPPATATSTPGNSYGFIRFQARVQ